MMASGAGMVHSGRGACRQTAVHIALSQVHKQCNRGRERGREEG